MGTDSFRMGNTYALLLQGVNVGGHALLSMATLRDLLSTLGFSDVRTYLQSGNAVVTTSRAPDEIIAITQKALRERLGRDVAVLARTAEALQGVVDGWPWAEAVDPTTMHVIFLWHASHAEKLRDLDEASMLPEQCQVNGPHLYLHLPSGMGRSKLGAWASRRLTGTGATTRNWNTVRALCDMASGRR